ncbi:G-type lectin S-receptor-like serine/threonine-protein kinase LECRK3 isoform X1 [Quercus robur]|uniref:G-type lectin S-receptor-like serine/threonine-protein kinase LECRK3 isoform X1 n=1 Tax=Quercus robur TaxID=38942 RepID=UPI0021617ECD|nr:G-type lectin S-receptor-like serine/threonine-protein kinase LECRK3 isoform X1 [Quercus robur]
MGSISVLFLLFMFLLAVDVKAQLNHSKIPLGSWLSSIANRTSWVSPSGLYAFGFYPQDKGYAIGIWLRNQPNNTIVWTADTDNQPVSSKATLNLTSDGKRLLLRTEHGEETSIAVFPRYYSSTPADSASMLDSGNFVVYSNSSEVIWESFNRPTDTILGGQNFSYDNADLVSRSDHSGRRYRLRINSKGNLVSYPDNSTYATETAYWSLDTFYGSDVTLSLNQRGLLRLIYGSSSIIISANNSYPGEKETTIIYRAMLDSDGIFRLYSHHFWGNSSNTSSKMYSEWSALRDQCEVKGFVA